MFYGVRSRCSWHERVFARAGRWRALCGCRGCAGDGRDACLSCAPCPPASRSALACASEKLLAFARDSSCGAVLGDSGAVVGVGAGSDGSIAASVFWRRVLEARLRCMQRVRCDGWHCAFVGYRASVSRARTARMERLRYRVGVGGRCRRLGGSGGGSPCFLGRSRRRGAFSRYGWSGWIGGGPHRLSCCRDGFSPCVFWGGCRLCACRVVCASSLRLRAARAQGGGARSDRRLATGLRRTERASGSGEAARVRTPQRSGSRACARCLGVCGADVLL